MENLIGVFVVFVFGFVFVVALVEYMKWRGV